MQKVSQNSFNSPKKAALQGRLYGSEGPRANRELWALYAKSFFTFLSDKSYCSNSNMHLVSVTTLII